MTKPELDELGVYSITSSKFKKLQRDQYFDQSRKEVCKVCSKHDGEDGVKVLRCKGCLDATYCSRICQKADWQEHKEYCRTFRIVDGIKELLEHFCHHPPLLHHLRVALIHNIGLLLNPSPDICWNAQVQLYLRPANPDDMIRLYTDLYPEPPTIKGRLDLFRINLKGSLNLDVPLSRLNVTSQLIVETWRDARKRASTGDTARKNPIIMVDFQYDYHEIMIGIEITPEAFQTALGNAPPLAMSLTLKEEPTPNQTDKCRFILERMNRYIEEDTDNRLLLRKDMGEFDKESIRRMGREMKRRRD